MAEPGVPSETSETLERLCDQIDVVTILAQRMTQADVDNKDDLVFQLCCDISEAAKVFDARLHDFVVADATRYLPKKG